MYNMKIRELIDVLNTQLLLARTISGRPISEYGLNTINSTLGDVKNHDAEITQCENCKFIASSLLFEEGCKNCGCKDLNQDVKL